MTVNSLISPASFVRIRSMPFKLVPSTDVSKSSAPPWPSESSSARTQRKTVKTLPTPRSIAATISLPS
ncbi:hypothetical protein [Streptomyces sp. B21-105]|uniref:hypothetical protein n=1 Tax=Streptomyces sp. B21-105 TaxID=3039417 RepID=UPI002FF22072